MIKSAQELSVQVQAFADSDELANGLDAIVLDAELTQSQSYVLRETSQHLREIYKLTQELLRALLVAQHSAQAVPQSPPQFQMQPAPAMQTQSGQHFLRLPEVERITGLKKSAVYAGMKNGTFPKCTKLGPRAAAWASEDIQNWIAEKLRMPKGVGPGFNFKKHG